MDFQKRLHDDKTVKNAKPLILPQITSTRPSLKSFYIKETEQPSSTNQSTFSIKQNAKISATSKKSIEEAQRRKNTVNGFFKKPLDSVSSHPSKREAFRRLMEESKANMKIKQEKPKKLSVLDLPERKFRVDGMIGEYEEYRRDFWNDYDALKDERDELEIKIEYETDEEKKKKMEKNVLLMQQELDRKFEAYEKEKNKYWSFAKKEVKTFNKKLSEIFGEERPKWQ